MFRHQRWTQKPPLGVHINPVHPLTKGLVGCWLFNEGSGDRVYDLSGYDNHGVITRMSFPPTVNSGWNPGNNGPTLKFDTDLVVVSTTSLIGIGSGISFTVGLWFKADTITQYDSMFAAANFASDNNALVIGLYSAGAFYIDTYNTAYTPAYDIGTAPHFVVLTADGTNFRLYADGNLIDTTLRNPLLEPGATAMGWGKYLSRYFDGIIEDVLIYDHTLTAQEVLELYENPYGMFSWPTYFSVEAPPPPTHRPRSPAVSGVPSAHF